MDMVSADDNPNLKKNDYCYSYPSLESDLEDGGYDSSDDQYSYVSQGGPPEVNLKNVLSGMFAIITGRKKDAVGNVVSQMPSSNVSFLGSGKNGETFLHSSVARLNPERSIPAAVLKGARAIVSIGLGWGAQVGGELMDLLIVLHDVKAVKTFCSRMHFSLGAGCSVAAGPVGRVVEADMRAGDKGSGVCYTYSCSKGAFVGVSLEGNFVATRMDTNLRFYGDPYLTTADILLGTVERPRAAEPLYNALKNSMPSFHPRLARVLFDS
nr:Zinc finger, FYVE-type [Ipomoea batatas]